MIRTTDGETCPCERTTHTASGRTGRIVARARRFATLGAWVVWDDQPQRPTWHPDAVLEATR